MNNVIIGKFEQKLKEKKLLENTQKSLHDFAQNIENYQQMLDMTDDEVQDLKDALLNSIIENEIKALQEMSKAFIKKMDDEFPGV